MPLVIPAYYLVMAAGGALIGAGYLASPNIANPRRTNAEVIGQGLSDMGDAVFSSPADSANQSATQDLSEAGSTADVCPTCPCERTVVISRAASPQAAQHIVDAQAMGHPSVLTYSPAGGPARSRAALSGIPTRPGMDRDEYPPKAFLEGGAGASVRHIPRSDNRSAGGQMAAQLAGATEGCQITMTVGP